MRSLPDPLSTVARADSAREFMVSPEWTLTYGEADRRVNYAAAALQRAGLGVGDRLALHDPGGPLSPNDVLRDVVLMLAAWRTGIVAVPLSGRMPPAAVDRTLAGMGGATLIGEDPLDPAQLIGGAIDSAAPAIWHLDRPATIVLTSGTTARPKAAVHSLGNHVWSARGWDERLPLAPLDRWLLALPLNHVAGLSVLFRCVLASAAIALPDRSMPLAEAIPRLGVTCLSVVTTQLRRLLEAEARLDDVKLVLLGGSGFPDSMLREASARRWPVSASYGLTEMASTVAATRPGAAIDELTTAGTVLPHRELDISSDGEIRVRGHTRFLGYAGGSRIVEPFDDEGWFDTGDLGEWQEVRGRSMLRIVGREDNLFISGGENIQPEQIESVLQRCLGVRHAVVVAVPDEQFGYRAVAFVEADSWHPEHWVAAVAGELPQFMVPRAFHPWPDDDLGTVKQSRARLANVARALAAN